MDAVNQQGTQSHGNGGFLQGVAQRHEVAGQARALPSHLLAELEFFSQSGELFAHHLNDFSTSHGVALFGHVVCWHRNLWLHHGFLRGHGRCNSRNRLHGQGFFLEGCCFLLCGFFEACCRHETCGIGFGRFGLALVHGHGVIKHFAKTGWLFLNQGRFFTDRRRRQTVGFLGRHKGLCQCDLGVHGFDINRHDQLGFASHLAGRDDKHVGAVQGNCLFVGRPGVTGNDSLEFHGVSRWSNKRVGISRGW